MKRMRSNRVKHILDVLLGIGLLLLMSYQVTGEAWHEWTGIGMTVLMILHQILNRKWYAALVKGRYTPLRTVQTAVNAALVICFVLTALCGINMSVHAVPFLSEFLRASLGRRLHLTLSHWCFVLMGLHLGLHIPAMLRGVKNQALRRVGFGISILAAGAGLWLFLRNSYPDYLFCRVPFALIDYDKAVPLALLIAFFCIAGSFFAAYRVNPLQYFPGVIRPAVGLIPHQGIIRGITRVCQPEGQGHGNSEGGIGVAGAHPDTIVFCLGALLLRADKVHGIDQKNAFRQSGVAGNIKGFGVLFRFLRKILAQCLDDFADEGIEMGVIRLGRTEYVVFPAVHGKGIKGRAGLHPAAMV